MPFRATIAAIVLFGLVGGQAHAGAEALSGSDLKRALSGKTVHLSTPLGVTVPIRYRSDGTMSGRAATILVQYVGSKSDRGRWWIKGDRVCQKWSQWLERKAYCCSFRKNGSRVFWRRSDGRTGTATISQ